MENNKLMMKLDRLEGGRGRNKNLKLPEEDSS